MAKKVYIIEDMAMSRAALISVLEMNNYEVVGSAAVAEEAWVELKKIQIDVVLIDVNLSGKLDGIWLAKKIRSELNVAIIFITAYGDPTTMKSINKIDPDGYIMKPYNTPTLLSTVTIASRYFSFKQTLLENSSIQDTIFIKYQGIKVKLRVDHILFIQSEKNYIVIFLKSKHYKIRHTIPNFLEELNDSSFVRIHRSFAINKNHIQAVLLNSILINEKEIPISGLFKENLKSII